MTQPPRLFDRDLHRLRLTRAAPRLAGADFLKVRAAEDLAVRLPALNRRLPLAVDLGARTAVLARALPASEIERAGGAGPRVSPFLDAYDGAALLQRAGLALRVVDVDKVVVRYDHPLQLMADLRAMGETNVLFERPRSPLTRRMLTRASEHYFQRFGTADGRIAATFEIITLTGWAPHPDPQRPLAPGSAQARPSY